jgi:hypothetical protein
MLVLRLEMIVVGGGGEECCKDVFQSMGGELVPMIVVSDAQSRTTRRRFHYLLDRRPQIIDMRHRNGE